MILKDKKKLELSYIPDKIICRDNEIKRIGVFIGSGRVLISGSIGTGKTMLARKTGGDAYVNCYINKTEHRVLEEILKQLRPRFNPAGLPSQRLWNEIESNKRIVLDEIEGMNPEDLRHFAYVLSRQHEIGKTIEYIAITRSHFILEQIINDDAIWSTFAGKSIVELKPYSFDQLNKILSLRAKESLAAGSYDDELLSLIADIGLISPGHMRTSIEILKNSSLIAENRGVATITPEDIREANREEWVSDINSMEKDELLVLLGVAQACKKSIYASLKDIEKTLDVKKEEYNLSVTNNRITTIFQTLLNQDFIYSSQRGFTILNYPINTLIDEIEGKLHNK